MPLADVTIRKGDTRKALALTLVSTARHTFVRIGAVDDADAFDLTGIAGANIALNFRVYDRSAAGVTGGGTVTVTSATKGQISYAWDAADVDTAGRFRAEVEIDDSGRLTFPSGADLVVDVVQDLADS